MKIPTFACPTDGLKENEFFSVTWARVRSNYVVNWGNTGYGQHHLPGNPFGGAPFTFRVGRRLNDITDGLSNTLLLSEVITSHDVPGWGGPPSDTFTSLGGQCFDAVLTPNANAPDIVDRRCPSSPNPRYAGLCVVGGWMWDAIPNTYRMAARSLHTSGVNVALCDGSIRFVHNSISLATWRALSTAAGGDIPGNDF